MAVFGCASASAATYRAVVGSTSGLVQVDTASNAETGFTASDDYVLGVAIAPGGSSAYGAGEDLMTDGGVVIPYTLGTGNPVAGAVLPFPTTPTNSGIPTSDIAVAPDGHSAYVNDLQNNVVLPLNLTTSPPTYGSAVAIPDEPVGIVYAPDGATAYVLDSAGGITKIDVASGVAQPRVQLAGVTSGDSIALSPDGSMAYVTAAGSGDSTMVYPVTVPGLVVGTPITAGVLSESTKNIAVSPDGTEAYVIGSNIANHAAVVAVDLTHGMAGMPLDIGGSPESVAVTPNGATIYATTELGASGGALVPIAAATMTAGTPITANIGSAASVAITAPPAPVPSFTVTSAPPGSATSFDASSSTVPSGTITDYAWEFGDVSAVVHATGPTITHVYAATGTYTATLTETASDGGVATATRSVVISTGPQPVFSPSAQSLSFGSVRVGTAGGAQALTVTNTGNRPLMITHDTLGGSDPGDFRLSSDGCDGQTVAASATCTVSVAFAPTIAGARTARLSFADNASGSPHAITLSGTGIAPAVELSGALDFGNTSLGTTSAARTVTLTNTGSAPLSIASDAVSGSAASEFAIGPDDCAGQTLAPGASCTTTVTFTPTSVGARMASLAYTDNAAGSPHTVALTGTGAVGGTVTGTVRDGTRSGQPPLAGAAVTLCRVTLDQCVGAFTDAHGRYTFTGVSPGSHLVTIDPPSGSTLSQGTRLADVVVGQTVDAVTLLERDRPLPPSITITQGSGSQAGGHPVLYWDGPFQITLPLRALPAHGQPNTNLSRTIFVTLKTAGTGQVVIGSALSEFVSYDAAGNLKRGLVSNTALPGTISSGLDLVIGAIAAPAGKTTVFANARTLAAATTVTAQAAGLQRQVHGTLTFAIDQLQSSGPSSSPPTTAAASQRRSPPQAHAADQCDEPKANFDAALTQLRNDEAALGRDGAPIVTRSIFIVRDVLALYDAYANLARYFCPPFPPLPADLYVDPSGFVVTRSGVPLEQAKVVLERSDTTKAPFTPPPNGNAVMAPNNRRNPDFTDLNGHFGWDVYPGFYRVRASRPGCHGTALSRVRMVPPPVTDLRLVLSCPGLHRATTHTRILSARRRGADTVVVIQEQPGRRASSRRGLVGVVTLSIGGRQRGFEFLTPRSGRVTIVIAGHLPHRTRLLARYAGNAHFAPSRASTQS